MILKGNARGGAKDLALHLMKDENEQVQVHELRGFASDNLMSALNEAYAMSRGTRCKKFLYSLSLNPPPLSDVSACGTVKVHGFGSFFENPEKAQDVDLLLLHESPAENSCRFVIACKAALMERLPHLHITMLSKTEERENQFIEISKAVLLGSVHENNFEVNIAEMTNRIFARVPNRVFMGMESDIS